MAQKRLKFELVAGIMLVSAEVDGQTGQMAFDTGAMQTVFHKAYFSMEKKENEALIFSGNVQNAQVWEGQFERLRVGELFLEHISVKGINLSYVEEPLRDVNQDVRFLGTLGMDIIRQYKIRIDYENGEILLNAENEMQATEEIPLVLQNDLFTLKMQVDGQEGVFILDTGANVCLVDRELSDAEEGVLQQITVQIGEKKYYEVPAVTADVKSLKQENVQGILGYPILCRQRLEIDPEREILRFGL